MVRFDPRIANRVPRYLIATAAAVVVVSLYRSILHVNQTTAALTFLVLIELAAVRWGLRISLYLSILSAFLYDYYFLPPLHTLIVRDRQDWIALLAFIASAVFISRLSEIARQQAESSEDRRQEMERLYGFSRRMLL